MKILTVVGARPNFMKAAPFISELGKHPSIKHRLVHTGQHYDHRMSNLFFEELGMPKPDVNLGVGSGTHAQQTAQIMTGFEPELHSFRPDLLVVLGDINSTLACSLVAAKLGVKVAHVEAGLRSGDRTMPEEVNRIVTDSVADFAFTTCREADENLLLEGFKRRDIFFVGNLMIDTLRNNLSVARERPTLNELQLRTQGYALLTLHRPSNVDSPKQFAHLLDAMLTLSTHLPVLFPVHPRTQPALERYVKRAGKKRCSGLRMVDALGYLDFLNVMANARLVLTDSGGIQEETTALGVPCLTLRDNTERAITIREGTNILVGDNTDKIKRESERILNGRIRKGRRPSLWDGKTAARIVKVIFRLKEQGRL